MSKIIKYDKLVRDKIPKIIIDSGKHCNIYNADEQEYKKRLINKLFEEVSEFKENPCEEEIADILEVGLMSIKRTTQM